MYSSEWLDKFRRFIFFTLFSALSVTAFAQNKTVSGTVVDGNNESVIGASVLVKGSSNGTITDLDGKFSLSNVPQNATLTISYVGYNTQQVVVAGKTILKITLQEDFQTLDEVVVVGYGVQKKSDITGALASVSGKELTSMPVKNALEGMQGRVAGVDITTSQRPGEVGEIRIRGERSIKASNKPLYVVDGMIIQNGGIENINPQDIESIDILKDASATAIYGSRGANGVVLVTTKKGRSGKISINYAGTVSFEKLSNVTEYMTAAEWLDYSRRARYNAGSYSTPEPNYTDDRNSFGSIAASWANIDQAWVDGVYHPERVGSYDWTSHGRQTGITNEHTISAAGGSDKFQGYASFGYLNQEGITPGQEYSRYTIKTSFDLTPKEWLLNMGITTNVSYAVQDYGYSFTKSTTGAGDYHEALQGMLPWTVPYDADGNYIRNPNGEDMIINPIDEVNHTTNSRKTFRASGLVYGQFNFDRIWKGLEGLRYRIQFGPEFNYYIGGVLNAADGINGDGHNAASYKTNHRNSWVLDNLIFYDRTFAEKHRVGVTLMQSASATHYENGDMDAWVLTERELWYNLGSLADKEHQGVGTGLTESAMTSYMGRINYAFNDRYLLTASMRWDGSSVLAPGHKWASFPSLALAWRIDQEQFMKKFEWINQLKLRLGYGVTGNSAIDPYSTKGALAQVNYQFGSVNNIGFVNTDISVKEPISLANQELGWEKTTQYNIGVDFSLFNGRLSGSVDYYKTRTKDLLLAMTIPSINGFLTTNANVGETEGHGWDIQLNSVNVNTRDFLWTSSLTWSMDRSKITALANGTTENVNERWFVGKPLGVYYDYVYDGIWKTSEADEAAKYGAKPGDIRVKDLDNSGGIDANEDRQIVGHGRPDWSAGFSNTFTYKGIDLSVQIYSRWGFTIPAGAQGMDGKFMSRKIDYWMEGSNENARYPKPYYNKADVYTSSLGYQDGSFIKLRNISLGYTFPTTLLNKMGMGLSNLRIYAQANNPFMLYSKCDWLDTDLINYNNNTKNTGSSTTIKSWVIGINVGF